MRLSSGSLPRRFGVDIDAGVDVRKRLTVAPAAPVPAAPHPLALALQLPAALPALAALEAAEFFALLAAQAGDGGAAAAALAPLLAALQGTPAAAAPAALAHRITFAVSPHISFGLGSLAFTLPSDARGVAAALAAPDLSALLSSDVSFEASFNLWIDIIFADAAPPAQRRVPLRRTLLQEEEEEVGNATAAAAAADAANSHRQLFASSPDGGAAATPPSPLAPRALLGAYRSLLDGVAAASGDAAGGAALTSLFVALAGVEFDALSVYVIKGAALTEGLRADTQPSVAATGALLAVKLRRETRNEQSCVRACAM
jgi:hypothetical protein